MWDRLTPAARQVMDAALDEAEQFGHDHIGDEHVLLGVLRDDTTRAGQLLRHHGLDPATARAELRRLDRAGLTPRRHADDAGALRAVGIDIEQVRRHLAATFGSQAVGAAVWRASRRPWWRGGGRRRTPLCGKALFVKRALALAAAHADDRGDQHISAEHLLHAVLRDAADPYGTGLGRRGRKHLAQLGWTLGTTNPAAAILAAHHLDPTGLSTQITAALDHER